jgi:hypothetical protein
MQRRVVNFVLTDVSEAVSTSETLVNTSLTTRRYIPEDSKLQPEHYSQRKLCYSLLKHRRYYAVLFKHL